MDVRRALNPRRDMGAVAALMLVAAAAVVASATSDFPMLHTILDTAAWLLSAVLAFLLWDMGWRTSQLLPRLEAVCFAVVALLEFLHVLTALNFSETPGLSVLLRPGTFSPATYLLPLGLSVALRLSRHDASATLFGVALLAVAGGLMAIFAIVPRYTEPGFLGITRPTLIVAPLLWLPVIIAFRRMRDDDRLARVFALFGGVTLFVPVLMLYSQAPADKVAMVAHLVRVAGELFLLFSLTQMGTTDTARRMRAEYELKLSNEALEARVAARTAELSSVNADLRQEVQTRELAERRAVMHAERLGLLERITHAIAERHDLDSIFQVVVRSVEEHMPADFAGLFSYDQDARALSVARVGARSEQLAVDLAMPGQSRIEVDENGLSRCVAGTLVYEPDIATIPFPFSQRLARGGLGSMVVAPLVVELRRGVFGVLVVARRAVDAFSSAECEFLRQLCDHVSLAANQAQLHASLKQAYDDLQLSQNAVMQQERLRALGQMASGIAHDINNAISPVALYVEAILTHEDGFSDRARKQLEIIQRAVYDVAQTVTRMGEFYRQRPLPLQLLPVDLPRIFSEVLDLTRARWSDMAQQRGAVIETKIESEIENPTVLGLESELREALINLVFNATDAMPEGGKLTLRAGHTAEVGKGTARRIFIEVVDTGGGMDEATRRRCLEPFFTTKGDRGSGLGLAMVYGITQRHGADIDIVSAPGEGATFRLTFPASPAAQSTSAERVQKMPRPTRILLIDDDQVLLTSLQDALVHDGHQVETANGGMAGIETFLDAQQAGQAFPVVITDLGMPHVDGRAVAAAIKSAAPATSIIMLTGWGQRLIASGEVPDGVDVVLSKPPKLAELRQCLAESESPDVRPA